MKKLVKENLSSKSNYLVGGKGDNLTSDDVDAYELEVGRQVEMEHTNNPKIAEQIALDHLAEHDDYYSRLVEAGLVDEPKALKLYKELILRQ